MATKEQGKLAGKVALITGGSRGIGRAMALAYAEAGARVFICARQRPQLEKVLMEMQNGGAEVAGAAGDVGKVADVQRIVQATVDRYGVIDVLINNASLLGPRVPVVEYPPSAWEEVLRVNLSGVFFLTQAALKIMIPRRQGSIINVSSGVGRMGKARWGAYAVSKFGVEGLTQVLAEELRQQGIRVNAVNPGATRTTMRAAAYPSEDPRRLPLPEEITEIFVYLGSDDSREVTGQSFNAQEWRGPFKKNLAQ
jgi:NAD(P)-dependent dehydrogenase (short-subunit alcohol dehydrogenase family)